MAVLPDDSSTLGETAARRPSPQGTADMARLLQAVKRNDVAVVAAVLSRAPELLTDRQLNGEVEFEGGLWTPLGLASRLGHLAVVQLLLSKGADVEGECGGRTARPGAGSAALKDVCEFGKRFAPLHLAALGRHHKVMRALLEAGANPNALDEYGDTPLYMAARQLSPECVEVLLELGGNRVIVDMPNSEDETPMMSALMALHQARSSGEGPRAARATLASTCLVIARLLEAGANPNDSSAPDPVAGGEVKYSSTMLAALEYGCEDLAMLLHLHGAKLPPGTKTAALRPASG